MPIRSPVRAFSSRYGAFDMDSIPPATATSYSPAWMALPASITARIPDPQTLWTVTQGTVFGMPAADRGLPGRRLADPGLEDVAEDHLLDLAPARTPDRSSAARMADGAEGRRRAGVDSFPRNEPIGVRAAERMTRFFIGGAF